MGKIHWKMNGIWTQRWNICWKMIFLSWIGWFLGSMLIFLGVGLWMFLVNAIVVGIWNLDDVFSYFYASKGWCRFGALRAAYISSIISFSAQFGDGFYPFELMSMCDPPNKTQTNSIDVWLTKYDISGYIFARLVHKKRGSQLCITQFSWSHLVAMFVLVLFYFIYFKTDPKGFLG